MSKEATIIQSFNDVKRQYEYFVKGYDVTESVKILLKRHKEEYDKEKNVFAGIQGFIEAQQLYEKHISDLEAKLAESERKLEEYKKCNCKECMTDYEKNLNQIIDKYLNENIKLKQQLAEKNKEIEKLNACVDFYKSYYISFKGKVIDELERVKEFCNNPKNRVEYEYCPNAWTYAVDKDKLMLEIDNQINELKGEK